MVKLNIRTKLIIVFLIVGLVPVIITGLLNINAAKTALHEEISNGILRLAESKEGQIYAYLDYIELKTIDFASDGHIRDSLKKISQGKDVNQTVSSLNRHLVLHKQPLDKTLAGIFIMDINGRIVSSTNNEEIGKDESEDNYFINGKKGVFTTEFKGHTHFNLSSFLVVSAPLTDRNTEEYLGVIANVFDTEKITDILSGRFQLEKGAISSEHGRTETSEVYVVNSERRMFVHPIAIGHQKSDNHIRGMNVNSLPVQKCLENNEEFVGVYKNYAGKEVIGASMCIPSREWVLLSELSTEEAFASINRIYFRLVLITVFFAFFVIFVALIFSNSISRPLTKMRDATREISKGKLNTRIKIKSDDEIGELAEEFNKMTLELNTSRKELKAYSKELEKKVEERTKDLGNKVAELTETKTAMINMLEDVEESNRKLIDVQEKLRKTLKEIKKLDKEKDGFISIAAHELKTPLTAIHGFSQLLQDEKILMNPEARSKYLKIIDRETKRLGLLVTEILDLSRIDLGTIKFAIEKVNLYEIIEKIKEEEAVKAKENRLKLTFDIEKDLPLMHTDKDKLIRILINLIDNAIKYTPEGSIKIEAQRIDDYIQFSIADTGIGIPKKYFKKVFKRFYQINSSYTRSAGGTGLGLSLCKEFVNGLDGKLWFESKAGAGTTFYFTLPLKTKIKKGRIV